MPTWLIVVAVAGGLVALVVWALCRVAGQTTRELERENAGWPLVCLGRMDCTTKDTKEHEGRDHVLTFVPFVSFVVITAGPDCRGQWHGEAICARP